MGYAEEAKRTREEHRKAMNGFPIGALIGVVLYCCFGVIEFGNPQSMGGIILFGGMGAILGGMRGLMLC